LVRAIELAEAATSDSSGLQLRVAIDYSSRDAILAAAAHGPDIGRPTRHSFTRARSDAVHSTDPIPDVDLLIRTGGERRLSDFLLWECAYAELLFVDCPWPEFGSQELTNALLDFSSRERRYGGLEQSVRAEVAHPPVEVVR
jgi:undecaprenyl diphosphate synthase